MYKKIQKFIKLFAQGMIYGANINAQGGDVYITGALN